MARISAFTLIVPDYDAAIAFYVGALGFDLLEDTHLSDTKRWVRVAPRGAETEILLAQPKNDRERTAIGNQTGGRVGVFLEVENFDAAFTRMKAHAVDFREAPRNESYGKVAVFADPFGNLWDLIEVA